MGEIQNADPAARPWAAEVSVPSFTMLEVISEVHYLADPMELWDIKDPASQERKGREHTFLQPDEWGSSTPAAAKQMSSFSQSRGPQCERAQN